MNSKNLLAGLLILFSSCKDYSSAPAADLTAIKDMPAGKLPATVNQIAALEGYNIKSDSENDFGAWLGSIPLKKDKTVYLYNGEPKVNQAAQYAVLNISVGNQNLQQCADAVMRLRAEYFYSKNEYERIVFTDNAGTKY